MKMQEGARRGGKVQEGPPSSVHRRPVTLYYKVAPLPSPQVLQLNPIAIDDASLQIKSVQLDGTPLTTFSGTTREVTLEANQGGKLAVVFDPAE